MASIRSFKGSDIAIIMQNISGIRMMIPNHIKLKPTERRSLFKLNMKRYEFVKSAINYMKTKPETVPNYIDIATCSNYLQLYNEYGELLTELQKIQKIMEDVKLQLGNDLMNMTKAYFHNTKFASEAGVKMAEPIYQQLKTNYAVGRNSKKEPVEIVELHDLI